MLPTDLGFPLYHVSLWPDPEVSRDVLQLVQCLRLVSDAVPGDMAYEMEKALEHLQSPERAAEMVLENLLANDKSVQNTRQQFTFFRNAYVLSMEVNLKVNELTNSHWPFFRSSFLMN